MKTKLTLLIISILFLSACSTTYYSSMPYDDVYYNGQNQLADDNEYNEAEVYEGEYDSEYAEEDQEEYQGEYNDYFNDFNSYYNYLYSARLRRFHSPHFSYGYYNNYFTNMYWYDMNPYMWGTSIYLNSGWMMPYQFGGWGGSFYAGFGFGGYGMGWPYYNYGWPYGYNYHNYYGIGYGFYPSYFGYYNRYFMNDYYYNSRDSYSQYYRHRPSRGRNYNQPNRQSSTFGEMYEKRYYASREDRNSGNNQRSNTRDAKSYTNKSLSVGTPSTGRNRSNTTIAEGTSGSLYRSNTPYSRLNNASGKTSVQKNVANQNAKSYTKPQETRKTSNVSTSRRNLQNTRVIKTYQNTNLKYSKPNTTKSLYNRNSDSRQYNTQQEYSNSGSRTAARPSLNRTSSNNSLKSLKRVITSPSRSSGSYTSPSRSNGKSISISRSSGSKSFSSPARSSNSRSFSSPSRSSSSRSVSSSSRSSSSSSSVKSSSSSSKSTSGSGSRGKR